MGDPLEGVVVETCPATAARCVCAKPAGHLAEGDDVHACDPAECTGSWRGMNLEAPDFDVVTFPQGFPGSPNRGAPLAALLGYRPDGALTLPTPDANGVITYETIRGARRG